jgi:hypothetical protein
MNRVSVERKDFSVYVVQNRSVNIQTRNMAGRRFTCVAYWQVKARGSMR